MALIRKIIRELIGILSELKSLISEPNNFLYLKRLYLRLHKVKHGQLLRLGRSLRLLRAGNLILGERCSLGDFVIIANHAPIEIGDDFIGAMGLHLDSETTSRKCWMDSSHC
ncbi:MAG: hypothetical protein KME06_11395 [Kastovskya adunca ATA6-11-RM4]|jgi:acetyltransferase-like isoleucine patch superfamily enzyme|nr:hypothetical protein [Kastovskya adunca ATA6-11-RM4]